MKLAFTDAAWGDYLWFQQHQPQLLKRVNDLIKAAEWLRNMNDLTFAKEVVCFQQRSMLFRRRSHVACLIRKLNIDRGGCKL